MTGVLEYCFDIRVDLVKGYLASFRPAMIVLLVVVCNPFATGSV
jgi:hypothetical protein